MRDVVLISDGDKLLTFRCPGCGESHAVVVDEGNRDRPWWRWNKDKVRPTLRESILVRFSRMTDLGWKQYWAWCEDKTAPSPERFDSLDIVCHSYIRDGQIQFLDDCTHELRGRTVPLDQLDSAESV